MTTVVIATICLRLVVSCNIMLMRNCLYLLALNQNLSIIIRFIICFVLWTKIVENEVANSLP